MSNAKRYENRYKEGERMDALVAENERLQGLLTLGYSLSEQNIKLIEKVVAERERLREALQWYECRVRDCNKKTEVGDTARQMLATDHGRRAREALKGDGDEV